MAYKATSIFGARLETRLEPWMTEDLARKCDAVGVIWQAMLEVAEETGEDGTAGYISAYGKLLDPATCPAKDLPYLGQFVGVEVPKGATEGEARELVKREAGLERGTLASIELAIKSVLGAGEKFTVKERTLASGAESAYWFLVYVKPGKSSAALKEAIEAVVPGGVFFTIVESTNAWINGTGKKWSEIAAGKKWSAIKEPEY